jgi:multidrug efflux system outer membrane protein
VETALRRRSATISLAHRSINVNYVAYAPLTAFQQVSDSLVAYQKEREFREQQELLTSAARDTDRLSNILYQHGGASFLQVLTSETNYFAAELNLALAQLNERLAIVQLYNALGGGWQQ